jgi:hypothetical protein
LLARHDIRQVIDAAQQMRDLFFEFFHNADLGRFAARRNGALVLAQPACIR